MERFIGIVIALLALGIMMTIHELGHFLVGRKLGFKITEFMIFWGPRLWSRVRNGIRYSLRLIPIGAAVSFAGGELSAAEDEDQVITEEGIDYDPRDPGLFVNRPKRYRAAVLAAGSVANIISGILIYFFLFLGRGYVVPVIGAVPEDTQAAAAGLQPGARIEMLGGVRVRTDIDAAYADALAPADAALAIRVRQPDGSRLETVLEPATRMVRRLGITTDRSEPVIRVLAVESWQNDGSPVFQVDDEILAIGGEKVTQESFAGILMQQPEGVFTVRVRRGGEEITVETVTRQVETQTDRGLVLTRSQNRLGAFPYALQYGWSVITGSLRAIGGLFTGALQPRETLSGPIAIVDMMSTVVAQPGIDWGEKAIDLVTLVAIISLSLGFTNLLPIPLLDGNHLLLLLIEAIRGRRLPRRVIQIVSISGVIIIAAIFFYGIYLDVSRIVLRG
ncbi:MAG: RIP metalloprotease RseP [Bacillota bacterium]|nr:RIP metalloprotease RseP [Bacillota bacterium]